MRKIINLTLLFFLLGTLVQQAESQTKKRSIKTDEPKKLTAEQIAKKYLPSVVLIVCDDGAGSYSQGSGFFVKEGVILTNHHVIEGMKRGKAKIALDSNKAKEWWIEKVLYTDEKNDLALLSVTETDKVKTPFLNLSETGKVNIGETIYVLSNPKGLAGTISQGIVSSEIRKTKDTELLQIDAPISSGSSGGAVLNARGEVVGIVTASLSSGQNLNFAVPVSEINSTVNYYFDNWINSEYYVFRRLSEVPNSWLQGQFNLRLPSSSGQSGGMGSGRSKIEVAPKTIAKPTFEETANWLIEKLDGKDAKGVYVKNIKFSDCSMKFQKRSNWEELNPLYTEVWDYSINLKSIKAIDVRTDSSLVAPTVLLYFNAKTEIGRYLYQNGIQQNRWVNNEEYIFFTINNKELLMPIGKAFERLKELCIEEKT
jgi:S1-C subfamily serine protease